MIGILTCDKCGRTLDLRDTMPSDEETLKLNQDEAVETVTREFLKAKHHASELGWKVSIGYDLCPKCVNNEKL